MTPERFMSLAEEKLNKLVGESVIMFACGKTRQGIQVAYLQGQESPETNIQRWLLLADASRQDDTAQIIPLDLARAVCIRDKVASSIMVGNNPLVIIVSPSGNIVTYGGCIVEDYPQQPATHIPAPASPPKHTPSGPTHHRHPLQDQQ